MHILLERREPRAARGAGERGAGGRAAGGRAARLLGGAGAAAAVALLAGCGGGDSHPLPAGPASKVSAEGAPMVVVPRLVGRTQDDAHRVVERAGLKLRWTGFTGKLGNGRYSVRCVKVLSQSPVAGERRPRGASIAVIETACRVPTMKPYSMFNQEPKR